MTKDKYKRGEERVVHNIPPLCSPDSRILILGSIPSPLSRETGFYYGNPRNRFWKVLAGVYGVREPETTEEKKKLVLEHGLALWDVLRECIIRGASDGSIREPVPNDIPGLLEGSSINKICTTGEKSYKLYMKYVFPLTGMKAIRLPSTSPANCAVSLERLIGIYSEALCERRRE